MKIGYARVSTIGQSLESQIEQLKENGCEKIFQEKQTGTSTKTRKQLEQVFDILREGDELIVTKIDRLARSIIDLNKLVQQLTEKGVSVSFLKDNMTFKAHDKGSPMQSLMFNVLGSFAQFERDMIVERTTEGRERAKKTGKHMGRPAQDQKAIKKALDLYDNREQNNMTLNDISKLTGVPRSTIYAEVKKVKEMKK